MAANTGVIYGSDMLLYTSIDNGTTWLPIAHATSHSINLKHEARVTRSKTTGKWPSRVGGNLDYTVQVEALKAYDGHNYYTLLQMALDRTVLKFKAAGHDIADLGGKNEEVGDKYLEGSVIITSVESTDGDGENATFSLQAEAAAKLEIKTVTV